MRGWQRVACAAHVTARGTDGGREKRGPTSSRATTVPWDGPACQRTPQSMPTALRPGGFLW